LNKATNELKILLNNYKQQAIQTYLESLYPTEATDYSLWKATKWLQLPQTPIPPLRTPGGEWAKSDEQKVNTLADHSAQVFQPHTPDQTGGDKQDMLHALENNKLPASPIKNFTATEVRAAINHLHTTKAPGYDLITGEILKKLPEVGISAITYIQGWAMKWEDFKGVVGLTVVECGGGELASPLLQVLPFSSNAAVDGEERAFAVKAYYQNGESLVRAWRVFRAHFNVPRNQPVPSDHADKNMGSQL